MVDQGSTIEGRDPPSRAFQEKGLHNVGLKDRELGGHCPTLQLFNSIVIVSEVDQVRDVKRCLTCIYH